MKLVHGHDTPQRVPDPCVAFHRTELNVILLLYGRMVAAGEWRDYGISMLKNKAIFSIFRRAAEHPIYRVEKHPHLRGRQGQYQVVAMDGQILKRGDDLKAVMQVLEKKMIRAVG
jgi:UDP-galactopyranose mutase